MGKKSNRGTKEAVQDRILFGFQKVIRQSGSRDENRPLSLAEQLEQEKREQDEALMNRIKEKANQKPDSGTYFISHRGLNS